ncbi:MAG: CHRD domain-containing protein [Acidobacteria bacterium]|nr:CHRD domain-containing protein [Acidobacteriota bacterium]
MRTRKTFVTALVLLACSAVALGFAAKNLRAFLTGYEEVPAVSTTGDGTFQARVSEDESSIQYELSYKELQGNVLQAHIHLGQPGVNGGISVWLCGNQNASPPVNPPAGTQPCPAPPATITGTITAANVIGPTAQGIAPGEFAELLAAIRAGATYVNVHTTLWPGGEIRSQIGTDNRNRGGKGNGKDGNDKGEHQH